MAQARANQRGKRASERREPHFGAPAGGGRGRTRAAPRPRFSLFRFCRRLVYWCLVLGIWGAVGLVATLGYFAAHLPPTSAWKVPDRPPNVEIVDASGELFANRGDTGGEAVRLEQLPPYLPQAVIAIEDRRFYSHFGIDPIGLARAVVVNALHGGVVQGGSTLTQQLAKNLFLEPDRTIARKMQEVVLSLWLEWSYSKAEILEMYLNRVYLGAGAYGVDAAARRYFGKPAVELDLAEAATIAGLLRAPSRYAPTRDPALATARAKTVLAAMTEEGFITASQQSLAIERPAEVADAHVARAENYVADWVMDQLPGYVGALDRDIRVVTTIDLSAQRAAERALRANLAEHGAEAGIREGALVALDGEGAVKALVGGRDYSRSQFDRAIAARRQPGSAFKPFVWLTALERGYTPDSVVVDEPVSIRGWRPENYGKGYRGAITLEAALAHSVNTVAARLAADLGPGNVTRTARRLGVVSKLHEQPSIALGTAEVTPIEITAAYVPFSNGGRGVIPHVIDRIVTLDGKVLFARSGSGPGRVVSPANVAAMNRMLKAVVDGGTGRGAALPGRPVGGKTGTSQEFRDAWFIGYTAQLTTGVWLGNDDGKPTDKATGGGLPAAIFREFMAEASAGMPVRPLPGTGLSAPAVASAAAPALAAATPPLPPSPIDGSNGPMVLGPSAEERGLLEKLFGG